MHHLVHRGFALAELLIALVLLGTITGVTYRLMVTGQRVYRAQTQRIDLQQNIRAAASVLPAELRVLNARDGDILAMSSDSITIRAMRLFAVACDTPSIDGGAITSRAVVIRNSLTFGSRMLTAGDSVLIYYEGMPGSRPPEDGWLRGRLSLDPVAARCAGPEPVAQARPGMRLTVDLAPLESGRQNEPGLVPLGAPVWGYEITTYKAYRSPSDGLWYLGQRLAGATTQPLFGPLAGASGLTLAFYDSTGAPTSTAADVTQIGIAIRGRTAQPVRMPNGSEADGVDSLVIRVALRNNRRF